MTVSIMVFSTDLQVRSEFAAVAFYRAESVAVDDAGR